MTHEVDEKIWKVAVLGAAGRMGSEAVRTVNTSADMDLVAALGRGDDLQELVDAGAEIVIDLTPAKQMCASRWSMVCTLWLVRPVGHPNAWSP